MATLFEKLNLKGHQHMLVPLQVEFFKQSEVDALAPKIAARAEGDATVWFAYPKGTSKKYTCDFNRDTGWAKLKKAGFDTVRAIAIDEDWTALRFRRVEFIKTK